MVALLELIGNNHPPTPEQEVKLFPSGINKALPYGFTLFYPMTKEMIKTSPKGRINSILVGIHSLGH